MLYQAKAQPVGDPADWVEPTFFEGWWVPPQFVSEVGHHTIGDQPVFAGDPAGFAEPVAVVLGWDVPVVYVEEPSIPAMQPPLGTIFIFAGGGPVPQVLGWERGTDPRQAVAGIPPLVYPPHTIAPEDFAVTPFSIFGWERPSSDLTQEALGNRMWEDGAPNYEPIITTPDLVNFVEWNPHYFIPPVPNAVYYTLVDWLYVAEPTVWDAAAPATGAILNVTVVASRNSVTPVGSMNSVTPVGSRNKADV